MTGGWVPAGTTYTGVSYLPPRDPTVLQTAGSQYPSQIKSRYTQLPDDIDPRIARFTSTLTRNATTQYGKATRIESWLKSNKTYSLNVSKPPNADIASQFMFDMDSGYCEYFATTMTVMLRSQGVPARYVVGYSTGQQIGKNTYRVRAMNAHAWVEVYFPDVGWVRFDPTPGAARLKAEEQAFKQQDGNGTYSPTEQGSPGESFTSNGNTGSKSSDGTPTGGSTGGGTAPPSGTGNSTTTTTGGPASSGTSGDGTTSSGPASGGTTQQQGTTSTTGSPSRTTTTTDNGGSNSSNTSKNETDGSGGSSAISIELDRTPVPGATVTVTVNRDGQPLMDEVVRFNGKKVGTTDSNGHVTAQVPYARSLTIAVNGATESAMNERGGLPQLSSGIVAAASAGPTPFERGTKPNGTVNGSQSYSLSTNITTTISGDTATGNTVLVTATIQNVPVKNARVQVNNRTVGRTNTHGNIQVQLPASPGQVSLAVSRGVATGQRTVTLPKLTVTAESTLPIALPDTSVKVTTKYGNDTVAGVPVFIGGRRVGTTDVNGTLAVSLPFQNNVGITAKQDGQTRKTTVDNLFVNLVGVLLGLALIASVLVLIARRYGISLRAIVSRVRRLPGVFVAGLFAIIDWVEHAIQRVTGRLRALGALVAEYRRGTVTGTDVFTRFRAWLGSHLDWFRTQLSSERVVRQLRQTPTTTTDDEPDESYMTIRDAWERFISRISLRDPSAKTPGELASYAIDHDGLPPQAVQTMCNVFRDVEYGARDPAQRLPSVEQALDALEPKDDTADADPDTPGVPGLTVDSRRHQRAIRTRRRTRPSQGRTQLRMGWIRGTR